MSTDLQQLDRLFEETARLENLQGLHLSSSGTAALEFSSGAQVLFEYVASRSKLYLYTPLLAAPTDPTRRLFVLQAMLECNFLKLDTGAGELAISSTTDEAVYQIELDVLTLDAVRLGKAIRDLLEQREACLHTLEYWKPRDSFAIANHGKSATSTETLMRRIAVRR